MHIWDVLSRRREGSPWEVTGSLNAPDLDMAMLLARETHFRRGEGVTYAVRRRGHDEVHECPDPRGIGGVIGKEYRRQEAYAGVGRKLRQVHELMLQRGVVIDRPRPPDRRVREDVGHG